MSYGYELTAVEAGDLYFCVNYGICHMETIDALRGSNAMSPIVLNLLADRADDPISASSGHRARFSIEHASRLTGSDYRYNRASGEVAYYLPLDVHRRRVLAGRVRAGWVRHLAGTAEAIGIELENEEDALLHPRKRFYAGGARSVRGYGENQLGPQTLTIDPTTLMEADGGCTSESIADGTCDPSVVSMEEFVLRPIGGTSVLEAGVEYRFPFGRSLTAALFVDGAIIGEGIGGMFSDGSWAVTPGVGIRFATPVGPVRLDLGVRPSVTERLPVVTEYVDEDEGRRLVELETLRRYNSVEAAGGGFLSEIFSRLALHLSIGEAY
jgi:outer membrane protein assembly factor BamA